MFHNIYLLDTLVLKLYDKDPMGENLELLADVSQSIVFITYDWHSNISD